MEDSQHLSWLNDGVIGVSSDGLLVVLPLFFLFLLLTFCLVALWRIHRAQQRTRRDLARFQQCAQSWTWEYYTDDKCLRCPELLVCLGVAPTGSASLARFIARNVHRADRHRVREAAARLEQGERSVDVTVRLLTASGEVRWFHWHGIARAPAASAAPPGLHGTCRDVTAENTVEFQSRLARRVIDSASDAVVVLDEMFHIVDVNPSFSRLTGYEASEVINRHGTFLCSGDADRIFDTEVRPALQAVGSWSGDIWRSRKDGSRFLARLNLTKVLDDASALHYVCLFSDVTERYQAEERLQFISTHDVLTGFANRAELLAHLANLLDVTRDTGVGGAVLFVDIDNFKQVNDSLGHATGDEVLQTVGKRLASTLRGEDFIARPGGDEFVLVLHRVRTREDAAVVARKLMDALRVDLDVGGRDLIVTVSIGICLFPEDGESAEELVGYADLAMARSKKRGRASYSFYEGNMSALARAELERENQLRHALEEKQFHLHYQPLVDVHSGKITGVEALLRWNNPESGLLMPGDFIQLAEERGLISAIGHWVLETACTDIAGLNRQLRNPLHLSVNVSSAQLDDPSFADYIAHALATSGLPGKLLRLELTESVIVEGHKSVLRILHSLRALGVDLALDDFGTGYSSLGYLRRFPITHLKIDRSFVTDLPADDNAASIVTTVIALARVMSLGVTAEGVETGAQSLFLEQQGCAEQQGFYFSRAQELADVRRVVLAQQRPGARLAAPT